MIKLGTNSIGKIYLGSNPIGKAYLGGNLIFQSGASPTPPTPTVTVSYIRGGGSSGSYIDTGITADSDTKIIVWARNFNQVGGNYNWLFGSRTTQNDSMFELPLGANATAGSISFQFGDASNWYNDAWQYCSGYHKYEMSKDGLFVDDTQLKPASSATFSNSANIHLFGYNSATAGHGGSTLPVDICACKIYKNNVLVRDFTAVNSPSVGLYDSVSDMVFSNAGDGSFIYGTFNPDAYTPLEYISTSGSSCLMTSIIGTYSLPIVSVFSPTGTAASWYDIIGGRDSTNRCQIFIGNTSTANSRSYGIIGTASASAMYSGSSGYFRNKKTIIVKANNQFSTYYNNSKLGSTVTCDVSSSYSTEVPLAIGASRQASNQTFINWFIGKIYYAGFGSQGSFVPAKVNDVAGMYDTYNDTFYPSSSSTPFTAGPEL